MPIIQDDGIYDWDVLNKMLVGKGTGEGDTFSNIPAGNGGINDIASYILSNAGIPFNNIKGADLAGFDILNKDAYSVMHLSLMANGEFGEVYDDGTGVASLHTIGGNHGSFDVLWSISSDSYALPCNNVLVIGADPPPTRSIGSTINLYEFASKVKPTTGEVDTTKKEFPKITVFGEILGAEACRYAFDGCIEYGYDPYYLKDADPTALSDLKLYDPTKFESILLYVFQMNVPFYDYKNTTIHFSNTSPRYYELEGFGTLHTRAWISDERYTAPYCVDGKFTIPNSGDGIDLPDSNLLGFQKVSAVYIYGYKLNTIRICEQYSGYGVSEGDADFLVTLDTMYNEPIALSEGDDYVIVQGDGDKPSKIVFSCNVREEYLSKYGGMLSDNGVSFKIDPSCLYSSSSKDSAVKSTTDDDGNTVGFLNDTSYTTQISSGYVFNGIKIFPVGQGDAGYVVNKIVVVYDWDSPCILIHDNRNIITSDVLSEVSIYFTPIILIDKPSPVSLNGSTIDRGDEVQDNDIGTAQSKETKFQVAQDSIKGGDLQVTLPFADQDLCNSIANRMSTLMSTYDSTSNITYMCGPYSNPRLCGAYDGGIINEIDFSYQDSSQYTVSFSIGSAHASFNTCDVALHEPTTQDVQTLGTVISVSEDNSWANVRLNKLGIMSCINCTRDFIFPGDRVNVYIYNNPSWL